MIRFFVLMLTFFILSCKEKKGYVNKEENNGDPVYTVTSADDEMNKASFKARATYNEFLTALKNPDNLMEDFSVKMRFDYGKINGEHMWLNNLHFRDEKLLGILNNDPVEIKTIKFGDTLEVIDEKISDWMYVRNNKLVGGYTIKVLYNKMTKQEQEEFKNQLHYELE